MKYEKLEIAFIQLERALSLFFYENDYISTITLAGAADEIIGKIRERKGDTTAYKEHKKLHDYIFQTWFKTSPSDKKFNEIMNGIRNGLKHLRNGEVMEFNPEQEAVNILDRAIENYFSLTGNETDLMKKLKYYQLRPTYPVDEEK